MAEHWTLERRGPIALATFARPPRNLMSFVALGELEDVLDEVADDESVSVLVLTGGVPGYFVAHADLDDLTRLGRGEPVEGDPFVWHRVLGRIESLPQPVVAAVNGQAWGGGSELSWACTTRVAAWSATFGQIEVAVGIPPGAGGTQRLPRIVGPGRGAELVLSGRVVDADEALRLGMVEAVLPDDGFIDAALDWLTEMASRPRAALVAAKRAVVEGLRLPLDDGLALEGQLFLECQTSPEALALQEQVLARYEAAAPDERITLDRPTP
jgi:enoyl-CoA hydratase/carnithine racemase